MIPLAILSGLFQTGNIVLHIVLFAMLLVYITILGASRLEIKVLKNGAILIFIAGLALYYYGYSLEEYVEGPITIMLRSILSSAEMFVSHNDLIEIEKAQEKQYFLDLFIFVYSCAVVTSISALLSLFAKRIMSLITMRYLARHGKTYRHIFFGLDQNSVNLAKNIDKNERIAFIEFPSDDEEKKISVGTIVQNVFQGIVVNNGLNEDNVNILKAKINFSEIVPGSNILKQMGLAELRQLADDSTSFYILSDDAEKNISDVMTLVSDKFFRTHNIQCHAYKTGLIRQYQRSLFDTHVHFFYPDTMSVLALRENTTNHPVNTVNIARSEDGKSLGYVYDDSFNALIFGFSESGKEVLRFLYKYSSFIGSDRKALPVKFYIQDPGMDMIGSTFRATVPSLNSSEDIIYEKVQYLSDEFWSKLQERIHGLKYIAFCSDNDTDNLNAATKVLDFALKQRENGAENMKILVRIVDSNDITKSICNYYNRKAGGNCILAFGDKKEMFSPKWLVSGDAAIGVSAHSNNCAEAMYNSYLKGLETGGPTWAERNEMAEKAREDKNDKSFLQQIRFLRQNIDNAFYSGTIKFFGDGDEELLESIPAKMEDFAKLPEDQRTLIDNISRTAHLSWVRQMVLDGYVYSTNSVDRNKTNEFICPWDEMSEDGKQHFRLQAKGMFIFLSDYYTRKI